MKIINYTNYRIILSSILIALLLAFSGCSENSTQPSTTNPSEPNDDVLIFSMPGGQTSYSLSGIPYDMMFSNKPVALEKVTFFEEYTNHGYTPYILVELNRENLTNDDIYWMTKYDSKKFSKEIVMNVYVDSEDNELDASLLNYIGTVYDDKYIYYYFFGDHSRYSYNGSEFDCQIIHIPTSLTESDTTYYHYNMIIDSNNYADSDEILTESERSAFYQAIENYLGNY